MPTAIGLDIGHSGVKIAVVDGTTRKFRVTRFVDHAFPEGGFNLLTDEEVADEIKRAFKENKISTAGASVVAMPAQEVMIRELDVPFLRHDQIEKTIRFQAESHFPSMDIDETLVEWYKFGEHGERSRLLVFGLPKTNLSARLRFLNLCGIDPSSVDLDAAALFNAFTLTRQFQSGENTLIVDIGAGSLKILLLEGGNLRIIRSIRTRMGSLPSSIFKAAPDDFMDSDSGYHMDLSDRADSEGRLPLVILEESANYRVDEDDSYEEAPTVDIDRGDWDMREELIDKVLLEIDRTMASVQISEPIEQIVVTGGGSRFPGIEQIFREHFMVETVRLTLSNALSVKALSDRETRSFDLVGSTALGLALKGVGYDSAGIDFRKEEFTHKGRWEKVKQGLAATCCLLFILFFVLAFRLKRYDAVDYQKATTQTVSEEVNLYRVLMHYTGESLQGTMGEIQSINMNQKLENKYAEVQQQLGEFSGAPQYPSALDQLTEFARGMKQSELKFKLDSLNIRQTKGDATLYTDDFQASTYINEGFDGSAMLEITSANTRENSDRQQEQVGFQYRVEVRWQTKEQ